MDEENKLKIDPNDINALLFREELIKLCKNHKCELSGSIRDDGSMYLHFQNGSNYEMNDCYNNYSVYKENENYELENVMEKLIRESFDQDSGEMAGLNNIKVYCGVITNDFGKASLKFQELRCKYNDNEIDKFIVGKDCMSLRLHNGERYLWVKPNQNSRGYRFARIIIDKNITIEELQEFVMPICYACGRDDVEIF